MSTWRVAKSLEKLRSQVDRQWPNRSKVADGTIGDAAHQAEGNASDHNPWVIDSNGVGVVTAFDLTHDPAHGVDCTKIVNEIVSSRDPRVKYIIWNRQIISSTTEPWVPRPYTGADPHTGHAHISVLPVQAKYDSRRPWEIVKVQRYRYELRIEGGHVVARSRSFVHKNRLKRASAFLSMQREKIANQAARDHNPRIVLVKAN